jgi:transcriptional regulator with XRE-family HTH domain
VFADSTHVSTIGVRRVSPRRVVRNVGLRIAELRRQHELTQEEFAELLKMDARHLQRIEAGEIDLSVSRLALIANSLDVDAQELLSIPRDARKRPPGRPRTK